ncbi:MAG TPA: hypothetical protein VEC60_08380 [Reyranella sp.]|nr:hypothetical protein [Reyranella sp.]
MRGSERRGSATLGWLVLGSVFGPMLALLALWIVVAVSGGPSATGQSSTREWAMTAMIWVLMLSGALLTVEGVLLFLLTPLRRRFFGQ